MEDSESDTYAGSGNILPASISCNAAKDKRKARMDRMRALPTVYDQDIGAIIGAMLLLRCAWGAAGSDCVVWTVGRVVLLGTAYSLQTADFKYQSNVFELHRGGELAAIRSSIALTGVFLNHRFVEYAAATWKVWRAGVTTIEKLKRFDGTFLEFVSTKSYCQALAVKPDAVGSCTEGREVVASLEAVAGDGGLTASSLDPLVGDASDRGSAQAARNLQGLHTTQGGIVNNRFTVGGLLACLQLSAKMKPTARLDDTLADASRIFFGPEDPLASNLEACHIRLPSLPLLRLSRVRLDVVAILYERMSANMFRFLRYILMDSSPQLGYNFLCVREDRVAIPVPQFMSPEMRANFDINSGFQTRLCPPSTLGVWERWPR